MKDSSHRPPLTRPEGWALALAVGAAGFFVNGFPLPSGWGLDFVLGGIVVFSALRLLSPAQMTVAGSIAAARTILLWNHPWAWAVWTVEAAVLGLMAHRQSPVRTDALFWIVCGTPLLLLTYGAILEMDEASLLLLILKHGINGVLCITLGELLYTVVLLLFGQKSCRRIPPISIDSAILALMVSVAVLPAVLWQRVDAPHREGWLKAITEGRLTESHRQVEDSLWAWRDARLGAAPSSSTTGNAAPVQWAARRGEWLIAGDDTAFGPLVPNAGSQVQLLTARSGNSSVALAIPQTGAPGSYRLMVLPATELAAAIAPKGTVRASYAMLIDSRNRVRVRTGPSEETGRTPPWLLDAVAKSSPDGRPSEASPPETFGVSPMNASRDSFFISSMPSHAFPGWKIALISRTADGVIEERVAQRRVMIALAGLILFLTMTASLLSQRARMQLDRLAGRLTDLALLGVERAHMQDALIAEVREIGSRISLAGSQMQHQRDALMATRRRLDAIVSYGGLVIYTLDIRDRENLEITTITPNVEDMFGFTAEEAVSERKDSIHPEDTMEPAAFAKELQPGRVITREYRVLHKQGHPVWIHDCLVVGEDEAVGFLFDITERKAAADALIQSSKMESLGRMAAGVAHELNQPLNFINLASQNLFKRLKANGTLDPDYIGEKLEKIVSQVKRASMIVGQVRTFGRSVTERSEVVAVRDVIDDVESLLKGQLDLEVIRLEVTDCDPDVAVRIHPVRLSQVLINLAINARDSILVRRQSDPSAGRIAITARKTDTSVEIAIDDDGTGIPRQQLPLLFEPFFTTKSPQEGTGLGLSVSYGIVSEAGGTISAVNLNGDPVPGPAERNAANNASEAEAAAGANNQDHQHPRGARFLVTLPLAKERPAKTPQPGQSAEAGAPSTTGGDTVPLEATVR